MLRRRLAVRSGSGTDGTGRNVRRHVGGGDHRRVRRNRRAGEHGPALHGRRPDVRYAGRRNGRDRRDLGKGLTGTPAVVADARARAGSSGDAGDLAFTGADTLVLTLVGLGTVAGGTRDPAGVAVGTVR